MARPKSRAARWSDACGAAKTAIEAMREALSKVTDACADLRSVQEEYEEWKDNLPENLQQSALGEKLEEVCGIDIENLAGELEAALDEAEGKIDEAEGADLPQGFGRD